MSQTPSRKGRLVNCTQGAFCHQASFWSPRLPKNSRFRPGLTTGPQPFSMIEKKSQRPDTFVTIDDVTLTGLQARQLSHQSDRKSAVLSN